MGAWGTGIYDNDEAQDLLDDLVETGNLDILDEALDFVLGDTSDAGACCEALVVADILAASVDSAAEETPEEVMDWLQESNFAASKAHLKKATDAVTRVLKESELQELWAPEPEYKEWQGVVRNLLERLKAPGDRTS